MDWCEVWTIPAICIMLMENAGINIVVQLGRTAVNSQVNNHGVDMRKDGGKDKTEISKLRVNGPRKTRVLRTLSHSQLMDQSRHDCSRRESTYVAKTEVLFKNNCLEELDILAGVKNLCGGKIRGSERGRDGAGEQMSVISYILCRLQVVS